MLHRLPTTDSFALDHHSNWRGSRIEPPSLMALMILGIALFWMMLPIIGPLDDHHFAERAHTHGHVYLDGSPVAHQHVYDNGLRHGHPSPAGIPGDRALDSPAPGGIFTFTSTTAGFFLTVLSTPYQPAPGQLNLPDPRGSNPNPLARFSPDFAGLWGIDVSPPNRPPIF